MKLKMIPAAVAFGCAMVAGSASAIVVGGVDFGALGLTNHIETTTLAETYIDDNGQTLQGYGVINTVNGDSTYSTTPGQKLYFVFNNYTSQNFSATDVEFKGGIVDVYIGAEFNLLNQSSATNLTLITGLTPWARFTGHGNLGGGAAADSTLKAHGTLTGSGLDFTGAGLLDVDTSGAFGLADVAAYLDADGEPDDAGGFADITLTTSGSDSVLNSFDTCNYNPGDWCIQGSADMRGKTVIPEPSAIALFGIGLIGAGFIGRRKAKKG